MFRLRHKSGLPMAIATLIVAIVSFAGNALSMAPAAAAEKVYFGNEYNPANDQMTHFEADEAYAAKPETLVVKDMFSYLQPWDKVCNDSKLPADQIEKLPCQTSNIKPTLKYHGVQVVGNKWMHRACDEACRSVKNGGGPFSTVIVQIDNETGKTIRYWVSHNHVTEWCDPTAHGEVTCIRQACRELGVLDLGHIAKSNPNLKMPQTCAVSHCDLYTSGEPCPMCYSATRWSHIDNIYFAATVLDAATQGVNFGDEQQYAELSLNYEDRQKLGVNCWQCTTDNSLDAFNWFKRGGSIKY